MEKKDNTNLTLEDWTNSVIESISAKSRDSIIEEAANEYIKSLKEKNIKELDHKKMESDLLVYTNLKISLANSSAGKDGTKYRSVQRIEPGQIAKLIMFEYEICKLPLAGANVSEDYDVLSIYRNEGKDKGTYSTDEAILDKIIRSYSDGIDTKTVTETKELLKNIVKRKDLTKEQDLIPVNNGIFNYKTKELLDFSSKYVFTSKSRIDYNENATNVTLYNEEDDYYFTPEDWFKSLSDNPEIVELLWEVTGAVLRPNVSFDKMALLYSQSGNNGKGTFCAMLRNLIGEGNHASIPLDQFSKEFALEQLIGVQAVIVDENDVDSYLDKAGNLKAAITHDVISINRKYKKPISYKFKGFMVQCVNSLPSSKDKSESFYRRQLYIPMTKNFGKVKKPYIKDDYLKRKEVLEYIMYRSLNMNYYQLSENDETKALLDEAKESNDPVREFWNEMKYEFSWEIIPFTFAHELYIKWYEDVIGDKKWLGRNKFLKRLKFIVDDDNYWDYTKDDEKIRTIDRMDKPEPLVLEFKLDKWQNKQYKGEDPEIKAIPTDIAVNYRCFYKKNMKVS